VRNRRYNDDHGEFGRTSLGESARLFALLNIALADAAIVSWDCKYVYNLWRPITAIQEADTDGNAATEPDGSWNPLLPTPPFPEYTSGHSTFSGAAAVVLAYFFGSDRISFSVGSDDLTGVRRSFSSFSRAAFESGLSRIYGGIHFPSANVYGLSTGGAVGIHVVWNYLTPVGEGTLNR
jgi:membrane-associated phospholipid phosphatase